MTEWLPLKRFVDPSRPITYGIVQAGPDIPGGVPYIRPVDMDEHRGVRDPSELRTTSPDIAASYLRSTICQGDLVVSIGPSFGKTMVVNDPALDGANLTQGTARVSPSSGVDPRFLQWTLQSRSAVAHWEASVGGATFRALNLGPLAETPIPVVRLPAQRAMADYLDTATARIDALITKKRRMIDLLDQRDGVLIEEALSHATVQEIPLRRLLLTPPKYGAGEAGVPGEEGWPRYIRITDVTEPGALRSEGILRLPPELAGPFLLKDGDLLLARSGTVGKAFLYRHWMGSAAFAGYLIQFRVDQQKILPGLLEAWTRTQHYWSQVRLASIQATIENVSAEKYKDFLVPLVPRNLQEEVLAEVGWRREKSRLARAALQRQVELLHEHRQALITAVVTGHSEVPGVAA